MDLEVATYIVDNGSYELELTEDYSGRGMYGEKTAAIVYPDTRYLVQAFVGAARQAEQDEDEEMAEKIEQATKHLRFDNMGRDYIVY